MNAAFLRRGGMAAGMALLIVCSCAVSAHVQAATPARDASLGTIKAIQHALKVTPPAGRTMAGKVKMALFNAYRLETGSGDRASIAFHDGTTLFLNQKTVAQLQSPTVTSVKSGEVNEVLAPGSNHQVKTDNAVAAAIGTNFLVRIVGGGSYFMVLRGAVLVTNQYGRELVRAEQGTFVQPGKPPEPAYPVDATHAISWTGAFPAPNLGENVALGADGGNVAAASSTWVPGGYGATATPYAAANIIDGDLTTGWESATGKVSNQSITVALAGTGTQKIDKIIIDPAQPGGSDTYQDVRHFAILVSTTGTDPADFHSVLTGVCKQENALESFPLTTPVAARYVKLLAVDNYGSAKHIALTELEVVSQA
jgi:hypothetical protein